MAQFGKHLFGTSYFGKTNTFDGDYETEIVDSGDVFTGTVDIALKAVLPQVTYLANSLELAYTDRTKWTYHGTSATAAFSGAEVKMLACGSQFVLNFTAAAGKGSVAVSLLNIETQVTTNYTLDTATTGILTINVAYANYILTIKTASATSVTFNSIKVMVANIGVEVRTASTRSLDVFNWSSYVTVPLTYNETTQKYEGKSPSVTAKKYVQARLHLATSDSIAAPVADAITISSGDITKYAKAGSWYAAINMKNAATDKSVTFKRVKRLVWKEKQTTKSTLTLRSTSIASAGLTSIPSETEVLDGSYWKAETAPYVVNRGTNLDYGTPISRISLGEKENGFTESMTNGSVLIGPINTARAGFADTKLTSWLAWASQLFYPTNKNNTSVVFELYQNKTDITKGLAPIFMVSSPELAKNKAISLPKDSFSESVFLRIVIQRSTGRQSPVVDYVDLTAHMSYQSNNAVGRYSDTLSGLDNVTAATTPALLGRKNLRTISHTLFNWPNHSQVLPINNQNIVNAPRTIQMNYKPKYAGQVNVGFGTNIVEKLTFGTLTTPVIDIKSKVTAWEPVASTRTVSPNNLYFHYTYDGGTVNFPNVTERDLSTDFTPNLLTGKKYRYYLTNGWKTETFQLPFSMTWDELAEMVDFSVAELKLANPNVKLYQNKLSMGFVVNLPNYSKNTLIQLSFQSTTNSISEKSTWNGTVNENILASIPKGGTYQYTDWVSDEVIYNGLINTNNTFASYVRTQLASYETRQEGTYTVTATTETAASIASLYSIVVDDLVRMNNGKKTFKKGEKVLVPSTFMLPEVEPGVIYDGSNPFVVEIIPDSVYRTKDNTFLPEDILISGSDDEAGIQYTLKESTNVQVTLKRGSIPNGKEVIPFSNVMKIISVKGKTSGTVYVPYQKVGASEMGDYKLVGNTIDWSASQSGSKEPAVNEEYIVTLTHGIVDTLKIIYTSEYKEKSAFDKLWRSVEVKELKGVVTPEKDIYLALPAKESFSDYKSYYSDVQYLVEDNDLWVQTSIKEVDGVKYLYATLNGEDPKRNWYPTVQTGFYYLNDQEYYLYSEPVTHTYGKEELPIIKEVTYSTKGLSFA